jgi:SAM-dependent methyltransferase
MKSAVSAVEHFQPPRHIYAPSGAGLWLFRARVAFDFQVRTVYAHARTFLPGLAGRLVDIGAGGRPYEHLVDRSAHYFALEVPGTEFGYDGAPSTYFDGWRLPYRTGSLDGILCTEVLEHVENPGDLVDEIWRVLKPGGRCMLTVPWSARYHYVPYDYYRYTPSTLRRLFNQFSRTDVVPRGTDLTVIAAKTLVVWARLLSERSGASALGWLALGCLLTPVAAAAWALGQVSLTGRFGSADDPLGYTVFATK